MNGRFSFQNARKNPILCLPMIRILLILFFASRMFGQDPDFPKADHKVNGGQTNIYTDAITHYIDSLYESDKPAFDTLFILKNAEITENVFPNTIKKIPVCFRDSSAIHRRLKNNRKIRAFNVFSDQSLGKDRINMIVVSFLMSSENKGQPTKFCRMRYYYNHIKKEFEFKNSVCDY